LNVPAARCNTEVVREPSLPDPAAAVLPFDDRIEGAVVACSYRIRTPLPTVVGSRIADDPVIEVFCMRRTEALLRDNRRAADKREYSP